MSSSFIKMINLFLFGVIRLPEPFLFNHKHVLFAGELELCDLHLAPLHGDPRDRRGPGVSVHLLHREVPDERTSENARLQQARAQSKFSL